MQISVIIPVYNRPNLIKRAVDSVLSQTEPPLEIIVVDDGSTDETAELLHAYGTQLKVIRQENQGVSAARNRGIEAARGDWIAFLDSDDAWLPEKLKMVREFHQQNPSYQIFQNEEIWIRHGRRVNPRKKHQKYGGWIFRQSLPLCIVSPSAVIIKRHVFKKVGTFDESFPVCEDYDLWLRISRQYPIGLDPRPGIIKYGGHDDQLSRKYWGMDHYRLKAMEKHLSDPTLTGDERIWVLDEMILKLQVLISGYKKRAKDASELQSRLHYCRQEKERMLRSGSGSDDG